MPTVLVTGASTGIGRATALRLAGAGWTVLAGVRTPEAAERLLANAGGGEVGVTGRGETDGASRSGGRLVPITLDIVDHDHVAQVTDLVEEHAGGFLDALVNNAGVAVGGPIELLPLERVREQMEVNFFGHLAVTQALLPALRRAHGRIVLISSIGGRVTTPFMAPYHASKYAIEALGDALRIELGRSHIQVALVEPGSIATPIWGKGGPQIESLEIPAELREQYGHVPAAMERVLRDTERRGIPPERVAATIEHALRARRMHARYLVGRDAQMMVWAKRLLPAHLLDRLIARALHV
ncbi:MAG TPA: SDR family oxidoreductase [Solirubrobacteraceae bacterium]|jgi:NAD(P)-dependent dehydrogenase (short-subunit alcohol dehydrogenase family)|nr:SDR family oxidoreductase [Solirubrobacteraceae bacterium]